jgi:hypothetical protein
MEAWKATRRQLRQERSVIDQVARDLSKARTGTSVHKVGGAKAEFVYRQIAKRWSHQNGGLPQF